MVIAHTTRTLLGLRGERLFRSFRGGDVPAQFTQVIG
ncbi:Uncharacterised protein [Mycobacteroides abscessus subsp. abscessus]|nr:Uncharacterised protein [Mycobacteroides abscessus subsp. abscessus]